MLQIQHSVSLNHLNTLHLNSTAINYLILDDINKLASIRNILNKYDKFFVLGGGSNLILPEIYTGLAIHNKSSGISIRNLDDEYCLVTAMSGENWDNFVAYSIENGCYGLENLSLIPGTVGAAPVQNIGAYGVEVKDFITEVTVFDWETGNILTLTNTDCQFSYRNSIFKTKPQYFVISVTFKLLKKAKLNTNYGDVAKFMSETNTPTPQDLRNIIINIRQNKLPNPNEIGNAGSFFHNPIIDNEHAQELLEQYPNLPLYPTSNPYKSKISAGWLIDNLGLKGYQTGNVGVYTKQALVLVNYGNATKTELLKFAAFIQNKVNEKYQIQLNIEPIIL